MFSSLRGFWSRHRWRVYIAVGVLGGGYALFKLYAAHRRRIFELDKQLESESQADEVIKAQLQAHFENIQRISDTTTLPYAMHHLQSRISEELDLSHLTEKLMKGKGQPNILTSKEKLELWERLKILSFTRTVTSLWAMTMLCMYVRVQINVLGRHIYLETARGIGSSQLMDDANPFDRYGQQEFLATADYLSNYGISRLIFNIHNASSEVLKEKQLRDPFSITQLREMIMHILEVFMSSGAPNSWVTYLVPENATAYQQLVSMSNGFDDSSMLMDNNSKLKRLMTETRTVLLSTDFGNIVEISLKRVVDGLVEEIEKQFGGVSPSGLPLVKILPRVAQLGPPLLDEPSSNRFVQIIRSLPEVELFYTLLYANIVF